MAYDLKTTIGTIQDNPKLSEIVERNAPGISKTPGAETVRHMALKSAAMFVTNSLFPDGQLTYNA